MRKRLIFAALIILAVFLVFNSQSVKDYNSLTKEGDMAVTISIDCKSVLSNYSSLDESLKNTEYIPENGIILPKTAVYLTSGATALDALKAAAKEHNIQLEYTQSPNDSYVEGINYIYEFSCGNLSGWMYKVNGNFADKGCNSLYLQDGDNIEWVYTCNLGKDVGEEYR